MFEKIKAYWDSLPKTIKVILYITVSEALAEIVKILSGIKVDSVWLAGAINVLLVVLPKVISLIKGLFTVGDAPEEV